MLTLHGTVLNVYDTPQTTDKKTGEIREAATRVQITAENTMADGQKRMELVTLKVSPDKAGSFRNLTGKPVSIPVGVFANGGAVQFYALKHA